jgi:hypothetical protein
MKLNLLLLSIFYFQTTLGQTSLVRDEIITVIQTDTLVGEYYKHLPIDGKFEQLTLFRNPNGTFDYVTMISDEYQIGKQIETWSYARINQTYYWIDVEKEVQFYPDSTIITSDFGYIKYNSDSTIVNASITGMYSNVDISCDNGLCDFESREKAKNRFCFSQEQINVVVNQLRVGTPEIKRYYEFGKENCP